MVRTPTVSTAVTTMGEKALQNASFPGGRYAGGTLPFAGDNSMKYRP
jgi:hypothetical protein